MRATISTALAGAALTGAALVLVATTAGVASASTPGPSVSNTVQTLSTQSDGMGGYLQSVTIDFTAGNFTIPAYSDRGTLKQKGMTVTLKITRGSDASCTFPGTYDAATTRYEGTYTCADGATAAFALSTRGTGTGSSPA